LLAFIATILLIGIGGVGAWLLFGNKSVDSDNRARANDNKEESTRSDVNRENNNYAPSTITTPTPMFTPTPLITPTPMATPSPINTSAARAEVMSVMNRWVDSLRRRNLYDNLRLYRDQLDAYYQYQDVGKEKVRASRQSYFDKYNSSVDVQLSDITIEFDQSGTTATVSYDNTYDWRGYTKFLTGKSRNEMVLSRINGEWLITSEKHISSYYENKN